MTEPGSVTRVSAVAASFVAAAVAVAVATVAVTISTRPVELSLAGFRVFTYLGVALLVGMLVVLGALPQAGRERSDVIWLVATAVSVVGSLGVLLLEGVARARGEWGDVFDVVLLSDTISSRTGAAAIVRGVLLALLALLWLRRERSPHLSPGRLWTNAVALFCVAIASTFSITANAADSEWTVPMVALDAFHLLAVMTWIGGLATLVLHPDLGRDVVARFSRIATGLVPVAVVSGMLLSAGLVADPSLVGENTYTRTLIVKVLLVGVVLGLAGATRLAFKNGLVAATRRGMIAEVVVAAMVLGVASTLVLLAPRAPSDSDEVVRTLTTEGAIATVEIAPARVGKTTLHIYVDPANGSLAAIGDIDVTLTLPVDGTEEDLVLVLSPIVAGANHWIVPTEIPRAGDWKLTLVVAPNRPEQISFATTIPID